MILARVQSSGVKSTPGQLSALFLFLPKHTTELSSSGCFTLPTLHTQYYLSHGRRLSSSCCCY